MTYGPGHIAVERYGEGVLITVHQRNRERATTIHLARAQDAVDLGNLLIDVAQREVDIDAELDSLTACGASIVLPSSDSHACLCLEARHEGSHQCEDCGTRWAG